MSGLDQDTGDSGRGNPHAETLRSLERTAEVFASVAATARRAGDPEASERMDRLAGEAADRLERARTGRAGSPATGDEAAQSDIRPVRVLLVDDHELAREALGSILGREPRMAVVGEAADGGQALALARRLRPDLVLMDVRMPGPDGLEVTRAIKAELPDARVLLLTSYDAPEYVLEGLRAGADGYLLKGVGRQELLAAVRAVLRGERRVHPSLAAGMLHHVARGGEHPLSPEGYLTARQRDVLRLLAAGRSNPEIARELQVSLNTVKTHVVHILQKLGATDRTQAAVRAGQLGLLD